MIKRRVKDTSQRKLTPEMVTEKIYPIILADNKPLRVPLDKAKVITMARHLAPQAIINRLVRRLVCGD